MRVLFPTDGSEQTEAAFENMLRMLKGLPGLEVTGLCIQHKGFDEADPEAVQEFDDDERDEVFPTPESAERAIVRLQEIADRFGLKVKQKVVPGNYRKEILKEAERHDVLAMHELSRSNLRDFLSGSATERLIRRAGCPAVLLVRSDVELS